MIDAQATVSGNQPPIGLVAGGGDLPGQLVEIFKQQNIPHAIALVKGEAILSPQISCCKAFSWSEIGKILKFFKAHHCHNLILLGSVTTRPDVRSILGDSHTMRLLPKLFSALSSGGDNTVLGNIIRMIEAEGFGVLGIEDVAPQLLIKKGQLGKQAFPKKLQDDRKRGFDALLDLAKYDIGQALIIENRRIIAVEGAEGTDAMLERIVCLRKQGRISPGAGNGFMIKMSKPNQDRRIDLPAIGPTTIINIHRAGLSGLVAQAGSVIVSKRSEVLALCQKYKLFLVGQEW